jgi:hypothetical protein
MQYDAIHWEGQQPDKSHGGSKAVLLLAQWSNSPSMFPLQDLYTGKNPLLLHSLQAYRLVIYVKMLEEQHMTQLKLQKPNLHIINLSDQSI